MITISVKFSRPAILLSLAAIAFAGLALIAGLTLVNAGGSLASPGLPRAIAMSGDHICVLAHRGAVTCSGDNRFGQLGNGSSSTNSNVPVGVTGLDAGVSGLWGGSYDTCALASSSLICWGDNAFGQLANGTAGDIISNPVVYKGLTGQPKEVAIGFGNICVLQADGGVYCSGANYVGQQANGGISVPDVCDGTPNPIPCTKKGYRVAGLPADIVHVAAAKWTVCAMTSGGEVYCWGANHAGELGQGTVDGPAQCSYASFSCSLTPVKVHGPPVTAAANEAAAVTNSQIIGSIGGQFFCVLTNGHVLCWGDNLQQEMGHSTSSGGCLACETLPAAITGAPNDILKITAGSGHLCVQTAVDIECAGSNFFGQLGIGTQATVNQKFSPMHLPTQPQAASSVALPFGWAEDVFAGGEGTCVLDDLDEDVGSDPDPNSSDEAKYLEEDADVDCTGANSDGQMGNGDYNDRKGPDDMRGYRGSQCSRPSSAGFGAQAAPAATCTPEELLFGWDLNCNQHPDTAQDALDLLAQSVNLPVRSLTPPLSACQNEAIRCNALHAEAYALSLLKALAKFSSTQLPTPEPCPH